MQTRIWRLQLWILAECDFEGRLESGGPFCVGAFSRNVASVAVKMFQRLMYFLRKCINVLSMRFTKIIHEDNDDIICPCSFFPSKLSP
jgi:hypothetical protein